MYIQVNELGDPDIADRVGLALSILEGDLERLRSDLKRAEGDVISLRGLMTEIGRNEKSDGK